MRRVLIGLVLLVGAAVFFLRWNRTRFAPPEPIKAGMAEVRQSLVSTYGVRTTNGVVLVDAGIDPAGTAIDALLKSLNADRDDVLAILLTHGHFDHTAAVPLFPHAVVYGGAADAGLAAGTEKPHQLMAKMILPIMQPPSVNITQPIEAEGKVGSFGRAFPLPGHTEGSMAYLIDGVLFVGDAIKMSDGILVPQPAWMHMNADLNRRSIWALQQRLHDEQIDRVCAAHVGCTPAGMGSAAFRDFVP